MIQKRLKGLTPIRFVLATLVLIMHGRQNLSSFDISWYSNSAILNKGGYAVECFFMLSGFLLMHLAILEFGKFGRIDFKKFYIRRILRIFPLYYLAIFLGYVSLGIIYPYLLEARYLEYNINEGIWYHIFFLPNWIVSKYTSNVGSLYGLWSIGVEEQFYILFPAICFFTLNSRYKLVKLGFSICLYYLLYQLVRDSYIKIDYYATKNFIETLKFHFMLIGCFYAIAYHKYFEQMKNVFSRLTYQIIILVLFILSFSTYYLGTNAILYGSIFCLFLVSMTFYKWELDSKVLNYLGTISFGIYIYHPLVSYPMRYVLSNSSTSLNVITSSPLLYYLIELLLTILAATVSYEIYEKKFLNMKTKYLR